MDDLLAAGERMAEGRFQQMKLVREVGGRIIDFLAQIEDFQKMLWEKRKFVTETHYCVTLTRSGRSEFYPDIAARTTPQWAEWRGAVRRGRLRPRREVPGKQPHAGARHQAFRQPTSPTGCWRHSTTSTP